jgi:hypothetical protein
MKGIGQVVSVLSVSRAGWLMKTNYLIFVDTENKITEKKPLLQLMQIG